MADPVPTPLRLLHLSDTHLAGDGTLHHGVVDTAAALGRVLVRAADLTALDAVVVTGDLTDDGSPEAYRALRDAVEPWAARRHASVHYVMGNHDLPEAFERVLGDRVGTAEVRGFRIVRLDSSVPEAGYGCLGAGQLGWLTAALREPGGEAGSVVLVHHPPIPAMTPLLAVLELQDPVRLLEICSAAGVLAILSGHYHLPLVSSIDGVTVAVAPGVTNTADVAVPAGRERARIGSGCALVEIPAAGHGPVRVTTLAAPSPQDGVVVMEFDEDQVARIAASAGPQC